MMREHDYYAILETYKLDGIEAGRLAGRVEGEAIGHKRGIAEGRSEGLLEGKMNIAQKMLSMGMAVDLVAEATSLSKDQVLKICNKKSVN